MPGPNECSERDACTAVFWQQNAFKDAFEERRQEVMVGKSISTNSSKELPDDVS